MIILYILLLLVSFYILAIVCERYFVQSLQIIGNKLRLSDDVVGATLMAAGSSAPELFTSLIATFTIGAEDIGAGTIVGSAIFNILIIIGASAYVATAKLKWQPVIRDLLVYILAIGLLFFTFRDGRVTLTEVSLYLGLYAAYIILLSQWKRITGSDKASNSLTDISDQVENIEHDLEKNKVGWRFTLYVIDNIVDKFFPDLNKRPQLYGITFAISIVIIIALSWILVESAVGVAHILSIPQAIIALTILAAGTSIPDLISSIVVARQGKSDMAISNATGSNIFDILFGLGLPWAIFTLVHGESLVVATENINSSVILLLASAIAIIAILIIARFKIGKKIGVSLMAVYLGYVLYTIYLI
ncbi:MAG: sodium:proton exchanger [Candidatus Kerfeldbacteria bacterium CG15_BIG_FIL_POST_REV_8_21_14_020_45_12]|uniref:Sodium:proton exchanger n=1 Tax=Candidatus Kerfeldbacteria bacterium CG15_BIG_FIL_POST_REV_8_21_14_020_45_12 TaxID=2014247 RepID=A0A2M7H3Y3_9BACT|nr:MAG: sodium:proton exchanger [Candidatus Kerfeldbacteria bacterium CG15_BIG_FIL_POST_REV_8_21_14_020_45_12]PJA92773.1 MAG: sodium:proton exchanger [Candidatus Kerfeldbacteria bacterium CG_4_9_14_3_um_filter_45_8]